mmetsp:Transcript_37612/g.104671  ORF Transcript_37612/g.104671 Transcript_37612/m.104671 type:complete len:200 (+) Transcript_37612:1351-1950(+)
MPGTSQLEVACGVAGLLGGRSTSSVMLAGSCGRKGVSGSILADGSGLSPAVAARRVSPWRRALKLESRTYTAAGSGPPLAGAPSESSGPTCSASWEASHRPSDPAGPGLPAPSHAVSEPGEGTSEPLLLPPQAAPARPAPPAMPTWPCWACPWQAACSSGNSETMRIGGGRRPPIMWPPSLMPAEAESGTATSLIFGNR